MTQLRMKYASRTIHGRLYSIQEAVEETVNDNDTTGIIEDIKLRVATGAEILGRLIETLYDKGMLNQEQVCKIIDEYNWEVPSAPEE